MHVCDKEHSPDEGRFSCIERKFDLACSVEEGEVQDEKAPLLLAYEQVYLPKLSKKQASEQEGGSNCQLASHRTRTSRRCRVPEWRDVLLTAALLWLAATGLILIIAMVKVGMYQVHTAFLDSH